MVDTEGTGAGTDSEQLSIEEYLARTGAAANSLRTYRKILTRCEAMMGKPLVEASKRDVLALVGQDKLRGMRSGPGYARKLAAFYRMAGRDDLAKLLKMKQRTRRLSPDEILSLVDVKSLIEAADSSRDRALIAVLWATGQRIGAVCAVRLGDVKTNGHGYAIFFRKVKVAGQEHTGYVLEAEGGNVLEAWLKAYPGPVSDEAPLFPSYRGGGPGAAALAQSGALAVIKSTARRAGFKKRVYPHLFRHSRATHLENMGLNSAAIKANMGWSQSTTVLEDRYSHLTDRDGYAALLKAHGLAPEEARTSGSLDIEIAELHPVVPMMAPPGRSFSPDAMGTAFSPEQVAERQVEQESMMAMLTALQKELAQLRAEVRGAK